MKQFTYLTQHEQYFEDVNLWEWVCDSFIQAHSIVEAEEKLDYYMAAMLKDGISVRNWYVIGLDDFYAGEVAVVDNTSEPLPAVGCIFS